MTGMGGCTSIISVGVEWLDWGRENFMGGLICLPLELFDSHSLRNNWQ